MTRKKRILSMAAVVSLLATVAVGYYLAEVIFEGSASSKAGTSSPVFDKLTASFPEGITPGVFEPLTIITDNTSGHTYTTHHLEYKFTTSNENCLPAWFTVQGTDTEGKELLAGTGTGVDVGRAKPRWPANIAWHFWKNHCRRARANRPPSKHT